MSYTTRISDLAGLKRPIRMIARGQINDLAVFFTSSFALIPWAAILRVPSYVRVLVGPFTDEQKAKLLALDASLGVFSPNSSSTGGLWGATHYYYDNDTGTPNSTLANVIRQIWDQHHQRIDWPSSTASWHMEDAPRWMHLSSLLDQVLSDGFSAAPNPAHALNEAEIMVTREVTILTEAECSHAAPLSTVFCEAKRIYPSDSCAARSSACPCGDEETSPPCRVDVLPTPNNDNLQADFRTLALYDDTSSEYTTRPSTASTGASTCCYEHRSAPVGFPSLEPGMPVCTITASRDTFGRRLSSSDASSTTCGGDFEPEKKEALLEAFGTDTLDGNFEELGLSFNVRGNKIITAPAPARKRRRGLRQLLRMMLCF